MYRKITAITTIATLLPAMLIGTVVIIPAEGQIFKPPGYKTITLLLAFPQDVETSVDTPVLIQLEGSALGGGSFAYWIYEMPGHGTLIDFDGQAGTLTFTPDSGFTGTDTFRFKVVNETHYSDDATVTVTVSENVEDERNSETGGKNWMGAIMFRDGLLAKDLNVDTIPESDNGIRLYDVMQGPLGMVLADVADGFVLAYGEKAWGELTDAQKIWLLENFYEIVGLT